MPVRIAMWSGPRNISTAMMRSWESRPDTVVVDEPLYAHFLQSTGLIHPARDKILQAQPTDWRLVVERLRGDLPDGASIWYQKHMAHHLTDDVELAWIDDLFNCFLIRDPRAMILSYVRVREEPRAVDLGLPQQVRLFEHVRERTGTIPPVIDSRDVLENPRGLLMALCDRIGVPFRDEMLEWKAGPRESDGVWAPHWYDSVWKSTGFGPWQRSEGRIPASLTGVVEECQGYYDTLVTHALSPTED